ncbi:TIGR02757 family protein [bacterium]|nr:TIGR02757 family protein [bacterium]
MTPKRSTQNARARAFLEHFAAHYARPDMLARDPVFCARRYPREEDRETAAFVVAPLAYGRVASVINAANCVLDGLGENPHDAVLNFRAKRDGKRFAGFVHRFTTDADVAQFLDRTAAMLREHGRIRHAYGAARGDDTRATLTNFVTAFRGGATLRPHVRYLLPDPAEGSACKRANLFLRWMVRPDDGVDMGLWPEVSPANLVMPLDTHVARISRWLGLLTRKSDDWLAAEEVTASLRRICPEDPLRFDYAITHAGISGKWRQWEP